jgi:ATP-dependent DNA helicase DinG
VPALLWGGKTVISPAPESAGSVVPARYPHRARGVAGAVSVALLKGRSNYLCHYHLERTLQNGRMTSRDDVGHLREISRFSK